MTAEVPCAAVAALTGAFCASLPSCIPGLHIYNLLGALVLLLQATGMLVPSHLLIPFTTAMVTSFAVVNTVPSILLAAPDESAMFTVLPGQKMMMRGRGYDAVLVTAIGSAAGLLLLVTVFAAGAPLVLPRLQAVVRPHTHWILWSVIAFMLMSEWPKPSPSGQAGWHRLLLAWRSTGMGILVFLLSGLLGFILLYRSPIDPDAAFQNLMPAFVGLFTLPWLLMNIATRVQPPPQQNAGTGVLIPAEIALRGVAAGALGGGFAAFFPVVTGGVGGLLAGHATALRDDRAFLISQGVSKLVYYAGGLLLLFTPGLGLQRGGAAALIGGIVESESPGAYPLALAGTAIGGAVALGLLSPLTRLTLALAARYRYRRISTLALLIIVAIVATITGIPGIAIMLVSAGIGILPVLYGARRMNALGVILLPMACNMSGAGPAIATVLHLF